jgi:hypothetical protein
MRWSADSAPVARTRKPEIVRERRWRALSRKRARFALSTKHHSANFTGMNSPALSERSDEKFRGYAIWTVPDPAHAAEDARRRAASPTAPRKDAPPGGPDRRRAPCRSPLSRFPARAHRPGYAAGNTGSGACETNGPCHDDCQTRAGTRRRTARAPAWARSRTHPAP